MGEGGREGGGYNASIRVLLRGFVVGRVRLLYLRRVCKRKRGCFGRTLRAGVLIFVTQDSRTTARSMLVLQCNSVKAQWRRARWVPSRILLYDTLKLVPPFVPSPVDAA